MSARPRAADERDLAPTLYASPARRLGERCGGEVAANETIRRGAGALDDDAPASSQRGDLTPQLTVHFAFEWVSAVVFLNGPMRVPFLRWRFRGGRVL